MTWSRLNVRSAPLLTFAMGLFFGASAFLAGAAQESERVAQRLTGLDLNSEPIAMQWDSSSRLWLLEREVVKGETRCRLWIVDPVPAEVTEIRGHIWADLLPDSSGFEVSTSGVWLASGPRLLKLPGASESRATDRSVPWIGWATASGRVPVIRSLQLHRDGWLYAVLDADGPVSPQLLEPRIVAPHRLLPGVIRLHPTLRILEQFTEGPLSPQSIAFDADGRLLIAASGRLSLFHGVEGGVYLPRESFPRPLHPMLDVQETLTPRSLLRPGAVSLLMGDRVPTIPSITTPTVAWLRYSNASSWFPIQITPNGSTLTVTAPTPSGTAFQKMSTGSSSAIAGPRGALFFRSQGGLVRMNSSSARSEVSSAESQNYGTLSSEQLAQVWTVSTQGWEHRQIQRAFAERNDAESLSTLRHLCVTSSLPSIRAAAFQIYSGRSGASLEVLRSGVGDRSVEVRIAVAQSLEEWRGDVRAVTPLLVALAQDSHPRLRREVALAARRFSSLQASLRPELRKESVRELFQVLGPIIANPSATSDAGVNSALWSALEPWATIDPVLLTDALEELSGKGLPVSGPLLRKVVRSGFGSGDDRQVDRMLDRLLLLADASPALCAFGLEGMMQGQRLSKAWTGHKGVKRLLRKLTESGDAELAREALRVDAMCGNPRAQEGLLLRIQDASVADADRMKAIEFTRWVPSDEARQALWELLRGNSNLALKVGAVDALREMGTLADAGSLLSLSDHVDPQLRAVIVEAFESKEAWWSTLLSGVETGRVNRSEIPPGLGAALKRHANLKLRARALAALGSDVDP